MGKSSNSENTLGRFRLLYQLGEGGMGAVFAARDLDEPGVQIVALKTTKQQGVEADRLLRDEAAIASQLDHQNVCRVHELGKSDDTQYMVLDYCDGASLHDLLQASESERLAMPIAVKICAQVAAGLHAAHELRGPSGELLEVIHRDVSPQNVLISSTGLVTVTDFGVAKSKGQAHRPTETGEVKGKASYMAPEQIRSRDIDRRADVFALACVLYQALLGVRPFGGDSTVSTLYQVLEEPIVLPNVRDPGFPPELQDVLMKALEKDRDLRFSTAEEFQLALEGWLVESGHLVTDREIEADLMARLGETVSTRKNEILRLAQLEHDELGPLSAENETASDTTPPATAFQERERKKPKGSGFFGLAAAVLVFSGALFWVLGGNEPDPPAQESIALPQPEVEAAVQVPTPEKELPPEEKLVRLKVKVVPETAVISIDGKEWGMGEVSREVEKSTAVRRVAAELEGYFPAEERLAFSEDKTLVLTLTKRPSKSVKPAKPKAKSPRKPATRKPTTRSLDSENPFAN